MPPRVSSQRLAPPSSCQCFRTRPQSSLEPLVSLRQLHVSPSPQGANYTKLRRNMWEWLGGSGRVFRDPLKGSTNYMSAYDKRGNLLRERGQQRGQQQEVDGPPAERDVVSVEQEAEVQRQEEAEGLDEDERQTRLEERNTMRERKAEWDARGGLPRERPSDMRPYPLNQNFRSESILSEKLREEIHRQVVARGVDISTVSAAFGVDMRRVAAVVRLKTIEKQWIAEGKPLAEPYNEAVLSMLPQTPYKPGNAKQQIFPHESVNDLPVHPRTRPQLFYPTSESRQFTREDAAKAFDETLLPADQRIPHPELITLEKEHLQGISREKRWARQQERDATTRKAKEAAEEKRRMWEERTQRVVPGRRWDFKFHDISAEKTGRDGRARGAPGIRYGMPHEDRKRGMVKIPTSVE